VIALRAIGLSGALTASAAGASTTTTTQVHYPSFLPKNTLNPKVDAPLLGTFTRPALQVEGLPVEAHTPAFRAQITVSGPVVPGVGLPHPPDATTCTWTVTVHDGRGDVPLKLADFHAVDNLGRALLVNLVPGEHAPPALLHQGQSATFRIRAYETVGQGLMQWAPDHRHVVGEWDYEVEVD
jgi:hypothetical protein